MTPVSLPSTDLRALYALIGRNIAGTDAGTDEGAAGSVQTAAVRTGGVAAPAPATDERPVLPDTREAAVAGERASPAAAGSLLGLRAPGTASLSPANRMALTGAPGEGSDAAAPGEAATQTADDAPPLRSPASAQVRSASPGTVAQRPAAGPLAAGSVRPADASGSDAEPAAGGNGALAAGAGPDAGVRPAPATPASFAGPSPLTASFSPVEGEAATADPADGSLAPPMDGARTADPFAASAFTGTAAGGSPFGAGGFGQAGEPLSPGGAESTDWADLFGLRASATASADPSSGRAASLDAASLDPASMEADAPLFAALSDPARREEADGRARADRFGAAATAHARPGAEDVARPAGDVAMLSRSAAANEGATASQAALATLGFTALDGFAAFAADAAVPMQAERAGVIASFILNAAMIPGWPPPRAIEGAAAAQVFAKGMSSVALTPGEAEMLMFLEHLIRNPALIERLMRLSERVLRRSRLLAAFAMLFTGLKELVAVVKEELQSIEEDFEDGEVLSDGGGRRHLVLG